MLTAFVKHSVSSPLPPAIVLQIRETARCSEYVCSPRGIFTAVVIYVQLCALMGMMGPPTIANGHHIPEGRPAGKTQAGH